MIEKENEKRNMIHEKKKESWRKKRKEIEKEKKKEKKKCDSWKEETITEK